MRWNAKGLEPRKNGMMVMMMMMIAMMVATMMMRYDGAYGDDDG